MTPPRHPPSDADLRRRVLTFLDKLSDRDTLPFASAELESIARSLPPDSFTTFISCLSSAVDSSHKAPVRVQCVRLLGLLSVSHGDDLSPLLPKMLSGVLLRRLRDSDSSVRSACVDAVSSMASRITNAPFSSFSKPLSDSIFHEQDLNVLFGASLCLAAAIEASPYPQRAELRKLLPRVLKLVKRKDFFPKAKPALLSLIGSIVGSGSTSIRNVLVTLVPCLLEYLSGDDWAARKSAAEALERLAIAEAESDLLTEFKSTCVANLESRKFDTVKVVRETMNRALEMWKLVRGDSDESSSKEAETQSARRSSSGIKVPHETGCNTPQPNTFIYTRSSPPSTNSSARKESLTAKSAVRKPSESTPSESIRSPADWRIEIAVPRALKGAYEYDAEGKNRALRYSAEGDGDRMGKVETKRALFPMTSDEKSRTFSGSRSGSRVVPYQEFDAIYADTTEENIAEDVCEVYKEIEDMSLIRQQLVQIEHQQSSLMELLQRFIGSSQRGMNSLETRVNGLEKALDEISHDLAISTGSNTNSTGNACCMLAGAEFLSPKFWRKTEGQNSRVSFTGRNPSPANTHNMPDRDANAEIHQLRKASAQHQSGGKSGASQVRDICGKVMENVEPCSSRTAGKTSSAGGPDGAACTKNAHQQN